MSMLARAAFAQSARMDRAAVGILEPYLTGTVLIGNSPVVGGSGTWSRPGGSYLYTMLRDGVPVPQCLRLPQAAFEAYQFTADDIGPDLDVRVLNTLGGVEIDSTIPIFYDSFTHLPRTSLMIADDAFVLSGGVQQWGGTYGGASLLITAAGAPQRPDFNPTGGVGGRALITTNGSSHILTGLFTSGAPLTSYALFYAGMRVSYIASATMMSYSGPASSSRLVYINDASAAQASYTITGGGWLATPGGDPDGVNRRVIGETNAGLGLNRGWLNGSIVSSGATSAPTQTDGYSFSFGGRANGAGDLFANWAVQAIGITADITDAQLQHIDALMKYRTGIV